MTPNYVRFFILFAVHGIQCARVITENGEIEGIELTTVAAGKSYHAFMGIPYAEAPIGALRFQPPSPPKNWTGVRNASYERSICVQTQNAIQVVGSEDCLYVNIFTPQLPTSSPNDSLLPVMVWIHGGAFFLGSGNRETQGPDYLLDEDVVVATMNYRLGLFGFLSTGDMEAPGNNGLKDQVAALRWLKNNIARFGGDPDKITIFGESAGASSVSYLVQSKSSTGLFRGAIMQSGVTLCTWSLSRNARQYAFNVGRRLMIFTSNSATLVNRLRSINYVALQSASVTLSMEITFVRNLNGLDMAPVKEPDHPGAFFTSKSCADVKDGSFTRVPLLVGFNSEEGNGFAPLIAILRPSLITYDLNQGLLVPLDMNIQNQATVTNVGRQIHSHYLGPLQSMLTSTTGFIHYFSDQMFVRAIRQYVKWASQYVDAYYYKFSYEGNLGNPTRGNLQGVSHAEDLSYIFWVGSRSDDASENDAKTRSRMVRMWTNFAKTGNPTPDVEQLLQNMTWPVASTTQNLTYLDIGANLEVLTNPNQVDMDFWDAMYGNYSVPSCDTY